MEQGEQKVATMQSLLITGATGFIGTHLVQEAVRRGIDCRCLVRASSDVSSLPTDQVELTLGTVEQASTYHDALQGCDAVVHLAGLTSSLDKQRLFRVNGDACGMLADACAKIDPVPRLVYVSSLAAVGPTPAGKAMRDETDPAQPISWYGRSKRTGEIALAQRAGRQPITVIRPGVVVGPGDKKQADLIRSIYRYRLHVVAGFRTPPLSLIHVHDLVSLILAAAERGETLQDADSAVGCYQACDDREFPTYWQFGQRIARAMDRRVFVWPLWRWVARSVAWSVQTVAKMRGVEPAFSVDKIREATARSWAASSHKTQTHFGFRPSQSLDEHLRDTCRWYVEQGWV